VRPATTYPVRFGTASLSNTEIVWIEKHKDRWVNSDDEYLTACVAPWMHESGWFVMNLQGGEVDGFATAHEAMEFVDRHPELFPGRM
jgi:hypothetical protein